MNQGEGFFGTPVNILIMAIPTLFFGAIFWLQGAVAVAAVLLGIFILFTTRIVSRHEIVWKLRKSMFLNGGLQWYKITPDSRKQMGDQVEQTSIILNKVSSALDSNVNTSFPYWNRGVVSILWHKSKPVNDKDTPKLSCYIGVSKNNTQVSDMGNLSELAKNLGGSVTKMKTSPKLNVKNASFAKLNDITMGKVSDGKKVSLSPVSEEILHEDNFYGHVVMSIEMLRKKSEEGRWKRMIAQQGSAEVGSAKEFSGMSAMKADYMLEHAYRTSIGVGSDVDNPQSSSRMLNKITSSLIEPSVTCTAHDPVTHHNRTVVFFMIFLGALLTGMFFLGGLSVPQFAVFLIVTLLVGLPAVFNSSILGRTSMIKELSQGNIVLPNFMYFSPRWLFFAVLNFYKPSAGSGEARRNRYAIPSPKMVLPLHHVPIASFMSLPDLAPDKEVDMQRIPNIGLSQDYVKIMGEDDLFIGIAGQKDLAYYPLDKVQYPLFCAGGMGSGKSNFMQVMFLNLCFQSAKKAKNMKITPVWGETKGKGAIEAWNLVKGFPKAVFLDVNNPNSHVRIALEGPRIGDVLNGERVTAAMVSKNAAELTAMLKVQWGKDVIGASSDEALTYGFKAALLLNEEELTMMDLIPYVHPTRPNVVKLCQILIGNDERHQIGGVMGSIAEELGEDNPPNSREHLLHEALTILAPYNDPKNRGMRERANAPKNKLSKLVQATSYWEAGTRKEVYIRDIVTHGAPVVINTGAFARKTADGNIVMDKEISDELSHDLLGCTVYSIWSSIQSIGTSWEDENVRVVQFYDEMSHIASGELDKGVEDPITGQVNEGRSYGDGLFMATQNLNRLPDKIANQAMSTPSRVWFKQDSSQSIASIMEDLGQDSPFTETNLKGLPQGVGVATIQTSQGKAGPCVLHVPYAPLWKKYLQSHKNMTGAAQAYYEDMSVKQELSSSFPVELD